MRLHEGIPREGLVVEGATLAELQRDAAGQNDPVFQAAVAALQHPVREAVVEVTGPVGDRRLVFSFGEDVVAVLMARPGKPAELAAVTPDAVPAVIAKTIGLGPGLALEGEAFTVPVGDVEALTAPPYAFAGDMAESALGLALSGKQWGMTRFETVITDASGAEDQFGIELIGAAGTGWWWIEREEWSATVTPSRAAMAWSLFCGLLVEE